MHVVGDKVRIGSKVKNHGGKPGFIVVVNEDGGPAIDPIPAGTSNADRDRVPRHPEYGIILTTRQPPWRKDKPGQLSYDSDLVKWFAPWEVEAR